MDSLGQIPLSPMAGKFIAQPQPVSFVRRLSLHVLLNPGASRRLLSRRRVQIISGNRKLIEWKGPIIPVPREVLANFKTVANQAVGKTSDSDGGGLFRD